VNERDADFDCTRKLQLPGCARSVTDLTHPRADTDACASARVAIVPTYSKARALVADLSLHGSGVVMSNRTGAVVRRQID